MNFVLLIAGLVLMLVLFWFLGRRIRQRLGFGQPALHRQLVSWKYGITGKPDFLLEHDGFPIPVLVKSGRATNSPHESHVAQILVYCLLVEETTKLAPPYGVIRYSNRTFEVDYNQEMFDTLIDVLEEMHAEREHGSEILARSHTIAQRCYACKHNKHCEEALKR